MQIKICGLFRDEDIKYVNEARPDYIGFVFAESKRKVTPEQALMLRFCLADGITPIGVFVNEPIEEVSSLFYYDIIAMAQLHGNEDEEYIANLKELCNIPVIKVIKSEELENGMPIVSNADYLLIDSGAGSGKTFNWDILKSIKFEKPWFLAGGINLDNIEEAMKHNPFAIDVSGGAETSSPSEPGSIKDREKILQLVSIVRKGTTNE